METYSKALETINPKRAHGKLQDMWVEFAKFYEDLAVEQHPTTPNLEMSRTVFEKSLDVPFKSPEFLAECCIAYAEMEMRHGHMDLAMDILNRGTMQPRKVTNPHSINFKDESLSAQIRLFKCIKLWSFYVDLEEATGTFESIRCAYDRMMELKIVTPQVVINYATLLEEKKYFEDSFKVYERGIELFGYPIAFDLWNIYLEKFMNRYVSAVIIL